MILVAAAAAPLLTGTVTAVHDGDTFTLSSGQRVRVFGIDAPELRQLCSPAPGQCVPCGQVSRQALSDLILGKPLTCRSRGKSYDREVAECSVDGVAIGPWMLERGQAKAYRQYLRKSDRAYLAAEKQAKAARAGLWSVEMAVPADWRNRKARLECER